MSVGGLKMILASAIIVVVTSILIILSILYVLRVIRTPYKECGRCGKGKTLDWFLDIDGRLCNE